MVKTYNLHDCDHCARVYRNKKDLVKHMREDHPVKKEKKLRKRNKLVYCKEQDCGWKSETGGLS